MTEEDREKIYLQIFSATSKSLEDISEGIDTFTPQQTDLYRSQLSALYGLLTDELARLEQGRAIDWLDVKNATHRNGERVKPPSDKVTDTICDATKEGQRRLELKYRLKAMEKVLSALAGRMHRLNQEFIMEGK